LAIKQKREAAKKAKVFMGASGGFGVGVFEDEDEDDQVYDTTTTSKFHNNHNSKGSSSLYHERISSLNDQDGFKVMDDHDDGDTLHQTGSSVPQQMGPDGLPPLPGFHYALNPEFPMEIHAGPVVPDTWKPRARAFLTDQSDGIAQLPYSKSGFLDPDKRRDILGEEKLKAPERSVFSFISSKAQDQIKELMDRTSFVRQKASSSAENYNDTKAAAAAAPPQFTSLADVQMSKDTALQALQGFIPFENDPAKQTRYKNFLRVKAGLETDLMKPPPVSFGLCWTSIWMMQHIEK
jgi:G patch domain-containing protein 1